MAITRPSLRRATTSAHVAPKSTGTDADQAGPAPYRALSARRGRRPSKRSELKLSRPTPSNRLLILVAPQGNETPSPHSGPLQASKQGLNQQDQMRGRAAHR